MENLVFQTLAGVLKLFIKDLGPTPPGFRSMSTSLADKAEFGLSHVGHFDLGEMFQISAWLFYVLRLDWLDSSEVTAQMLS